MSGKEEKEAERERERDRDREMSGKEEEEEKKVVCVTGGSGYIASWLVKLLLSRGYTVRASVRDLSKTENTNPISSNHISHLPSPSFLFFLNHLFYMDHFDFSFYICSPFCSHECMGPK